MRFVTYNLLNDHPKFAKDPTKNWTDRRPHLIAHLQQLHPDLLAIQEGRPRQLADLQSAFPHWDYAGDWSNGPYGGEQVGFFYDRSQWLHQTQTTYWLSPTPTLPSLGWDAKHYRIAVHLQLQHRPTGVVWHCLTTHLSAFGPMARLRGLQVIRERIAPLLETPTTKLLLAGDFNAHPRAPVYQSLHDWGALGDAHRVARRPSRQPAHTFVGVDARWTWQKLALHCFYPRYMHRRIDYVWVSPAVQVEQCATSPWTYAEGRYYPSDHWPVVVDLS